MPEVEMARILIIEDDPTLRAALTQYLKAAGFLVTSAENGKHALDLINDAAFDVIVSDIRMPGLDGVSTVTRIKESYPFVKTILITGYSDDEPLVRALNLGVDGILKKPFGMRELLHMISVKLAEKDQEEAKRKQLRRTQTVLAKMAKLLPHEPVSKDFHFYIEHEEADLIASLIEVGRMAEMRQEADAAILAYEKALSLLAGSRYEKEECPVRLALSRMFEQKNEPELSHAHALEAVNLAQRIKDPGCIADARLQLAKILFNLEPFKAFEHLVESEKTLLEYPFKEKEALCFLLLAAFTFRQDDHEKTQGYLTKFASLGRRHFLSQALVASAEITLLPLLVSVDKHPERENLLWVIEESAPYLQARFQELMRFNPSLIAVLQPLIHSDRISAGPLFQIFGLGKLKMFHKGMPMSEEHWSTSKGLSMFLFLFYHSPNLISDEQILDNFWPQLDLEKGRHSLRTTLYLVRRTLGSETAKAIIYNEKQKFGIRGDANVACDFLSFRRAHHEALHHWKRKELHRAVFYLKESDKLYKETFLQGWSDPWVLSAREFFKDAYLWNTLALASYLKQQRIWHEALAHAQKALALDPAIEEAHACSIECLLELGRRDDAIKQFHLCKDALKKEMSIAPSERLRDLYWRAVEEQKVPVQ